jgi:signal peptidase I
MGTPRPFDLKIAEQVEAVAIAIAMALVLKFFVIEAYQIPTGSMQPTILGDAASGIKDRVLADKLCTMLRDPRRWEVMIFRFPLDERRLYVKRIVGLPGERLEIRGGDVWIDGKIARKPDHVNDSVLKAVFPVKDGGIELGRAFAPAEGVEVQGGEARFLSGAEGELRLRSHVKAEYLHGYDPDWKIPPGTNGTEAVADLELAFDATLDEGAQDLRITLTADEGDTVFTLPVAGSGRSAAIEFRPVRAAAEPRPLWPDAAGAAPAVTGALPAGRTVRVVARNIDREVTLRVDGELVARIDDDRSPFRTDRPDKALATLAIRGGGSVGHVIVRRDIYYTPRVDEPVWQIPEDSYFGLGDNTQGSLDSRGWELQTIHLRDGSAHSGFFFPPPRFGAAPPDANPRPLAGNRLVFADVHGDEVLINRADIADIDNEAAPFIHRRYLLGKAIVVFWPVLDPFRWKLIR